MLQKVVKPSSKAKCLDPPPLLRVKVSRVARVSRVRSRVELLLQLHQLLLLLQLHQLLLLLQLQLNYPTKSKLELFMLQPSKISTSIVLQETP
jgi:hypothetical protein